MSLGKKIKSNLFILSALSAISCGAFADAPAQKYVVVAPACLTKSLTAAHQTYATSDSFSLMQVDEEGLNQLIEAKIHQPKPCGGFMNVTEDWLKSKAAHSSKVFLQKYLPKSSLNKDESKYSIRYTQEVNQLLSQLNPQEMWGYLTTLTTFKDRYANSDNGVDAANWLKAQVEQMAKDTGHTDVQVSIVNTGSFYKQPSVVAKFGTSNEAGVVIGGHMDTLSSRSENKPGADDDGTGTVTVLEVARTLLASHTKFKKPIYFIWYSAEEEGLVGSQFVVKEFKNKNIPIDAVIHFDMTGYAYQNDPTMWLLNDYTDKDLTSYLETLITTYVKQPVKYTRCGYACSDHASWTQGGYRSAIAFEAMFGNDDPYIHTAKDTMNVLSLSHMTDFAKLGVAYVTELAEPQAAV